MFKSFLIEAIFQGTKFHGFSDLSLLKSLIQDQSGWKSYSIGRQEKNYWNKFMKLISPQMLDRKELVIL
jgi:hypothetical protein